MTEDVQNIVYKLEENGDTFELRHGKYNERKE
jgi:hypothetical protein